MNLLEKLHLTMFWNILWHLTFEYIYNFNVSLKQYIPPVGKVVYITNDVFQQTWYNCVFKYTPSPYITAPINHIFSQKHKIFTDTIMSNINTWHLSAKTFFMMNSSKIGILIIFSNESNLTWDTIQNTL